MKQASRGFRLGSTIGLFARCNLGGVQASAEEFELSFSTVMPHLGEVQRRVVAGAMARAGGRGGKTSVAEVSGLSRNTVIKAQAEVVDGIEPSVRQRAPGAGDKRAIDKQPGLLEALDELVHPSTRGTSMSGLRWTFKSTYELARDLQGRRGFRVSAELVRRLLHQMGYSLQAPAKQNEGAAHPSPEQYVRNALMVLIHQPPDHPGRTRPRSAWSTT